MLVGPVEDPALGAPEPLGPGRLDHDRPGHRCAAGERQPRRLAVRAPRSAWAAPGASPRTGAASTCSPSSTAQRLPCTAVRGRQRSSCEFLRDDSAADAPPFEAGRRSWCTRPSSTRLLRAGGDGRPRRAPCASPGLHLLLVRLESGRSDGEVPHLVQQRPPPDLHGASSRGARVSASPCPADVDRSPEPPAQLDRRGAGGLVLVDADPVRETCASAAPRPPRRSRPRRRSCRAGRRTGQGLDLVRRGQLHEVVARRPLGAAGDEGQPVLVAHRHGARGRLSASTGARSRASSHALPTEGWPAKSSSTAGVKMRISPRPGSSTNTVSLRPRSATAWRRAGGTAPPSRKTASGLPPEPSSAQKTRSR